jgi:hypothetical protein
MPGLNQEYRQYSNGFVTGCFLVKIRRVVNSFVGAAGKK